MTMTREEQASFNDICDCHSGAGDEWKVYLCPLHAAAPKLLKALDEADALLEHLLNDACILGAEETCRHPIHVKVRAYLKRREGKP